MDSIFETREALAAVIESGKNRAGETLEESQIADLQTTLDEPQFDDWSIEERRFFYDQLRAARKGQILRSGPTAREVGPMAGWHDCGWLLAIAGVIIACVALALPTSVETSSIFASSDSVYNLGRLQTQILVFVGGCSLFIAGIGMTAAAAAARAIAKMIDRG